MTEDLAKHYDTRFYETYGNYSRQSAAVVVPIINKLIRPRSVLDVGCGVATWLAEWIDQGVTDVLGLDGEYVSTADLQIGTSQFQAVDLRNPFSLGRTFELVECLEVAEHLDESCAEGLVESIGRHADTVLFSAAIPGQGGAHHVNEQWPSYWVEKFSRSGFRAFDVIRPLIWGDAKVNTWYRQNTLLFSRKLSFDDHDTYLDVVHPELWRQRQDTASFTLRQLLKALPNATVSSVRWYAERAMTKLSRH